MPRYCPAGDGAFADGVERCPECGRRLQDAPPDPRPPAATDDPVVYLATVPNEPLARLLEQVLRDEGIRVLVRPKGPGFGGWGSVATFEHELFVLRSQFDRAQEIVDELQAAEATYPADGWADDDEVP